MNLQPSEDIFDEDNLIHAYSRADALADGVLISLMQGEMEAVCRQHFRFPIAATVGAWALIQTAVQNTKYSNDYAGVLHDILYMSRVAGSPIGPKTRCFGVLLKGAAPDCHIHSFRLTCGPGDDLKPVLTLMLPGEE